MLIIKVIVITMGYILLRDKMKKNNKIIPKLKKEIKLKLIKKFL